MSKWHLFLVFLLMSLLGCKPSGQKPDGEKLIPREKMIDIMANMEVVEAKLRFQQTRINMDSLQKLKIKNFDSLYMYYKVTPGQFNQNLRYYQEDLADFELMMDEVILSITQAKDSVLNIKEVAVDSIAVKADSIAVK